MKNNSIITIDGPVGTGKSTVAWKISQILGFNYLNSGVFYRIAASYVLDGVYSVEELDAIIHAVLSDDIFFRPCEANINGYSIIRGNKDITSDLSKEECGNLASLISQSPKLREALIMKQRNFESPLGLVADGRDMGSMIFPHASFKIFLTASVEVRAERRWKQLIKTGNGANITDVRKDIIQRDFNDTNRKNSPLVVPEGAVKIDTSSLSLEEVVDKILSLCELKSGA